ncbi:MULTISPECIES: homoserine O-acetyltransferase MetA [Clostridium]|uniref:homoserine O-acetyltransferase MetA n=1 Tax=Clostridium TaxID=1485 RepID=UPI00019B025E|nr:MULTISPECIES: homoserine O-succinyltransferase [Clostridium]EEH98490.1 homoserine O-succinyltransferase [Clostridium sp. 7_2_43FAA]MBS5885305.1 homoserine O-succinyltransferase [Clostridium sp.]MBS6502519.1 homoserine O-succinyltransferase [Clostridium sp.]MDB1935012.1 homoserine O-succinyltransferase [Clostridium tertium]MDB1938697.1 homoserine O-succinyltransferase [Clostridium tertium]
MPIKIPVQLPAYNVLSNENIFVMNIERAETQDIRPLKIAILNLMPIKIQAENQLLRYLSNTPIQVEITLIQTKTYTSQNTPIEHLEKFYNYFEEVKDKKFDGLIITGAPVETMEFEDVSYWNELKEIMEWSKVNVFSTLHICWGAQAALYYHYNINKKPLEKKIFGVFSHEVNKINEDLTRGLDDIFYAPHSRHTTTLKKDINKVKELEILAESEEAGVFIIATKDKRQIFITGHLEYDRDTLKNEYLRDYNKGIKIEIPKNYFPKDDVKEIPTVRWRGSANIVFSNWLNYCVYQNTPFKLENIK